MVLSLNKFVSSNKKKILTARIQSTEKSCRSRHRHEQEKNAHLNVQITGLREVSEFTQQSLRAGSLNIKRLLLINGNLISQVKEFSVFLCIGSLGSLKSFLQYKNSSCSTPSSLSWITFETYPHISLLSSSVGTKSTYVIDKICFIIYLAICQR